MAPMLWRYVYYHSTFWHRYLTRGSYFVEGDSPRQSKVWELRRGVRMKFPIWWIYNFLCFYLQFTKNIYKFTTVCDMKWRLSLNYLFTKLPRFFIRRMGYFLRLVVLMKIQNCSIFLSIVIINKNFLFKKFLQLDQVPQTTDQTQCQY